MSEPRDIRVLVVDDDDDDYLLLKTFLGRIKGARYVLARASTYESGLERLALGEHDVCLLDYRLGAHDGLELLDEALRRGYAGPFVMLTGQESRELDLEAMRRGAADFLSKSRIDESVLERSIRYSVERARAHDLLETRVKERTAELQAARHEAERLYREAQAANRLKDEFLATLSHELRTPLHVIIGYADLLKARGDVVPEAAEIVEIIRRNANVQARLVDDLLDVSRIVTGKLEITQRPVVIATLARTIVDSLKVVAQRRGVTLAAAIDVETETVLGDGARLEQVVGNLLSNALKFTPAGGRVSLTLRREADDRVVLRVEDTGEGIAPDFLPFVFDRFRQADAQITRKHGGLGLGLSIARHLVEAHGGEISAASAGAGKGSSFTVTLPLASAAAVDQAWENAGREMQTPAGRSVLIDRAALAGVRVLVVDDAPDVVILLKGLLVHAGATVVTANSAADARRRIATDRPDVLISDIGMPVEDGYELIRSVRAAEIEQGLPHLPAAAMTAYARLEEKTRALEAGFELHVPKPVDAATLIRTVSALARFAKAPAQGAASTAP